jgi:hypothetical protein
MLGASTEEQRMGKALRLEIVEQILIRPHARVDRILAAVPFVEHEGKRSPSALVEKQIPA